MLNNVKSLVKREVIINYKLLAGRLPLVLLLIVTLPLFSKPSERRMDILIIWGFAINLFFSMVYFTQVYLQELKNDETKFLLTFLVEKNKIVTSKIAYILLLVSLLNFIIIIPQTLLSGDIFVIINVFICDVIIGTTTGIILLSIFLKSHYEMFLNINQYIRGVITIAFIASVYLLRLSMRGIRSAFDFNPLLSLGVLILLVYLSNKLLQGVSK